MRLYFEDPHGRRLAIDTDKECYCTNYEGDTIPDNHRFIWVCGEMDLTIIERELDFNMWAYNADFVNDGPPKPTQEQAALLAEMDPFYRPPRTAMTPARQAIEDAIKAGLESGGLY